MDKYSTYIKLLYPFSYSYCEPFSITKYFNRSGSCFCVQISAQNFVCFWDTWYSFVHGTYWHICLSWEVLPWFTTHRKILLDTFMFGSCHLDRASNDKFSVECLSWFFQPTRKSDLKVVQITKNYLFWVNVPL